MYRRAPHPPRARTVEHAELVSQCTVAEFQVGLGTALLLHSVMCQDRVCCVHAGKICQIARTDYAKILALTRGADVSDGGRADAPAAASSPTAVPASIFRAVRAFAALDDTALQKIALACVCPTRSHDPWICAPALLASSCAHRTPA